VWGQAGAGLKLVPPHADRGAVEGDVASGLLAGILAKGTFDGRARLLVEDGLVGAHRAAEDLNGCERRAHLAKVRSVGGCISRAKRVPTRFLSRIKA
jgi:hypothetical protein